MFHRRKHRWGVKDFDRNHQQSWARDNVSNSSESKFAELLINARCDQDPHYVGADDEGTLIKTDYVKWHKMELFDTNSFYNFCLPLTSCNN